MDWIAEHKAIIKRLVEESESALGYGEAFPYAIQLVGALQALEAIERAKSEAR